LLPFFAAHRLSDITIAEVDRYRNVKVREAEARRAAVTAWQQRCEKVKPGGPRPARPPRPLSATSINKTITRLGQILERAVEYDLIGRNPARIGKRKLKVSTARRAYLDDAELIVALLDAAAQLDEEARHDGSHVARRTLLATLAFSGLRIGELLALRWRDVDLAGGRLRVTGSKTDAGVRDVTLLPVLRDELATHRARSRHAGADAFVFATRSGRRQSDDNLRTRVLAKAIERANEHRAAADLTPLPEGLTFHSLRHTAVSALFALGHELPVVMAEIGHSDPKVTLGIYAHVMRRGPEAKAPLRALVEGTDWAPMGTSTDRAAAGTSPAEASWNVESPR
ncbi:MAG: tyrosine-type recombinase/integrase, partial [Solirubrobacteraceae bacterium]